MTVGDKFNINHIGVETVDSWGDRDR